MLILDLFAKMLSVLSSCYLWKFEGETGSTSESPNLFLHAGPHQQEPLEWPYLLFSWKSVSLMSKELLRRNTNFLQEDDEIRTFLLPGINHLSLRVHGIIIHLKDCKTQIKWGHNNLWNTSVNENRDPPLWPFQSSNATVPYWHKSPAPLRCSIFTMENEVLKLYFKKKKNLVRALFLEEFFKNQLAAVGTAFSTSRKTLGIFNIYEKT